MKFYQVAEKRKIICHFGIGLVGHAIFKSIIGNGVYDISVDHFSNHWDTKPKSILNVVKHLKNLINKQPNRCEQLDFIWTAGRCGFMSSDKEIAEELDVFNIYLNHLNDLLNQLCISSSFHLVSSAGGLYETGGYIKDMNALAIDRPYGHLKKMQEEVLMNSTSFSNYYIYRISSVYSKANLVGRKGLISTMLENGINNKVTRIFGEEHTLRDYILDDDIAKYIRGSLLFEKEIPKINLLVSGKPSSIFEIKSKIESLIQKRLYVQYPLNKSNASNICFSQSLKPPGLEITSLEFNLKCLLNNLIKQTAN